MDQSLLRPSSDVVSRRLGDSAVLIRLSTSRIYELNATGARIWELIEHGATLDSVLDTLAREFHGARDRLQADVSDLVTTLSTHGLLARS